MHPVEEPLIALVEDEEHIRQVVAYALKQEGYRIITFKDGQEAWASFDRQLPDLVILDIIMPLMDGLELCRRIRRRSEEVPVIFLTSRDEEFDRVLGLELGADDYLCKPFSTRELIARIKVLFRRLSLYRQQAPVKEEEVVRRGPLIIDTSRYTVHWKDRAVPLTVTEFRILLALARQPGHVKTRDQLLVEGYPQDDYMSGRTIDTHIKRLRRKFSRIDPAFAGIETIYGLGYRYTQPPESP